MSAAADLASHYREVRSRLGVPSGARRPAFELSVYEQTRTIGVRRLYEELIGPTVSKRWKLAKHFKKRDILYVSSGDPRSFQSTREQIARDVCSKHGVSWCDIVSDRRPKEIIEARQEIMWRLSRETGMAAAAIGRFLGNRDHTTVLYGVKAHIRRAEARS